MNIFEAVQLRAEGYTGDGIKAFAVAWNSVPEPIHVVATREGQLYYDGQPTDIRLDFSDGLAWAGSTPVVVLEPLPGGNYRWHDSFNPEAVADYRNEVFELTLQDIKRAKWANRASF